MEENALISVIVPVYNVEPYLSTCLESILHSTYKNLEIICINDASTDGSPAILQAYADRDSRIRVIDCPENGGLSAARNLGLDSMNGAYVAFVDSDDTIAPQMLELLLEKLVREDSDVAICGILRYPDDDPGSKDAISYSLPCGSPISEQAYWELFRFPQYSCINVVWNKLYRAERFAEERFRRGIQFEDMEIAHRLMAGVRRISVDQEAFYFWRTRSGSITQSVITVRWYMLAESLAARAKYLTSRGWSKACAKAISYGAVFLTRVYVTTREDRPRYEACRKALMQEFRLPMLFDMPPRNALFFILFALRLDIPAGWAFLHFIRRKV